MTQSKLLPILQGALNIIRLQAPIDTGLLRYDAIKFKSLGNRQYEIYIDEAISPYAKYTIENWENFAAPLQGKTNPNEGWWFRACEAAIRYIASQTGGELRGG